MLQAALAEAVDSLMKATTLALFPGFYLASQSEASAEFIASVDRTLIEDGTYFVADVDGALVACGLRIVGQADVELPDATTIAAHDMVKPID